MAGNGSGGKRTGSTGTRRPSAAVYRRRRLVALVIVILVVVGLVWAGTAVARLIGGGPAQEAAPGASPSGTAGPTGSATDAGSPSATASPTASDSASGGASGGPAATCNPADVSVTAGMNAQAYPVGATPVFSMTIENTGKSPCELNMGTSQMEFLVTSGSDRIFSSKDCQADAEDLMRSLVPGEPETANFPWDGKRSAPDCAPVDAEPAPGTYVLEVRLGSLQDKATFQLQQ